MRVRKVLIDILPHCQHAHTLSELAWLFPKVCSDSVEHEIYGLIRDGFLSVTRDPIRGPMYAVRSAVSG